MFTKHLKCHCSHIPSPAWLSAWIDPISLKVNFLACICLRFFIFQHRFIVYLLQYAFSPINHMRTGHLCYFSQCQNLLSALFIWTLKFANHVIFVPTNIFGHPILPFWLRPWRKILNSLTSALHITSHTDISLAQLSWDASHLHIDHHLLYLYINRTMYHVLIPMNNSLTSTLTTTKSAMGKVCQILFWWMTQWWFHQYLIYFNRISNTITWPWFHFASTILAEVGLLEHVIYL